MVAPAGGEIVWGTVKVPVMLGYGILLDEGASPDCGGVLGFGGVVGCGFGGVVVGYWARGLG